MNSIIISLSNLKTIVLKSVQMMCFKNIKVISMKMFHKSESTKAISLNLLA